MKKSFVIQLFIVQIKRIRYLAVIEDAKLIKLVRLQNKKSNSRVAAQHQYISLVTDFESQRRPSRNRPILSRYLFHLAPEQYVRPEIQLKLEDYRAVAGSVNEMNPLVVKSHCNIIRAAVNKGLILIKPETIVTDSSNIFFNHIRFPQ